MKYDEKKNNTSAIEGVQKMACMSSRSHSDVKDTESSAKPRQEHVRVVTKCLRVRAVTDNHICPTQKIK